MREETWTIAPKPKRLGAWIIDGGIVFLLWYFLTEGDLRQVNDLLAVLDPVQEGALDAFAQALFQMGTKFLLKWLFCQTLYYCLAPALLGRGKTVGKLLFRLSLVDRGTGQELSPSRLVLREFAGRSLVETLLVLPGLVSLGMVLLSSEGRSLRDRIAAAVVIEDGSHWYES